MEINCTISSGLYRISLMMSLRPRFAFDLLLLLRSLSWIDVCICETNELSDELGENASTALPLPLQLSSWIDWVKLPLIGKNSWFCEGFCEGDWMTFAKFRLRHMTKKGVWQPHAFSRNSETTDVRKIARHPSNRRVVACEDYSF